MTTAASSPCSPTCSPSSTASTRGRQKSGGPRRVEPDRVGLALERDRRALLEVPVDRAERAQRGLRDEDVTARPPRGGLDTGGGFDRIADAREVAPPSPADGADHHPAGVHAHADPQAAAGAV